MATHAHSHERKRPCLSRSSCDLHFVGSCSAIIIPLTSSRSPFLLRAKWVSRPNSKQKARRAALMAQNSSRLWSLPMDGNLLCWIITQIFFIREDEIRQHFLNFQPFFFFLQTTLLTSQQFLKYKWEPRHPHTHRLKLWAQMFPPPAIIVRTVATTARKL